MDVIMPNKTIFVPRSPSHFAVFSPIFNLEAKHI